MAEQSSDRAGRRYTLRKIRTGLYLLPDNDGVHLWRIRKVYEDGSAYWTDEKGRSHPVLGEFWSVEMATVTVAQLEALDPERVEDFLEGGILPWDRIAPRWVEVHHLLPTRAEAIRIIEERMTEPGTWDRVSA